jgi:catechol 2,3-dioxygenase-like lactoylglutathione lyase family enzyme
VSQPSISMKQQKPDANGSVDMRLEVDVISVADVERTKQFYGRLGWRLDDDVALTKDVRIVQFTPPGSECSVTFGKGITTAAPGSAEGTLVVSDIEAAHGELVRRGIEASEVWHGPPFPPEARLSGPDPKHTSYGSFFTFNDPDGNGWIVQEVTLRRPGRTASDKATFSSVSDLAGALRRAGNAHSKRETRTGKSDPNWPDWYAAYMVAEQLGTELPK